MLTCSVKVPIFVDVALIVDTEWIGEDGTLESLTSSETLNATRFDYTTVATIDRVRSGNYICKATIRSMSKFITGNGTLSDLISITVGKYNNHFISVCHDYLSIYRANSLPYKSDLY